MKRFGPGWKTFSPKHHNCLVDFRAEARICPAWCFPFVTRPGPKRPVLVIFEPIYKGEHCQDAPKCQFESVSLCNWSSRFFLALVLLARLAGAFLLVRIVFSARRLFLAFAGRKRFECASSNRGLTRNSCICNRAFEAFARAVSRRLIRLV